MGYSIVIGELKVDYGQKERYISLYAHERSNPDAPRFANDFFTENTNCRSLSYIAWGNFLTEVGLSDLFFDGQYVRGGHPGVTPIGPAEQQKVTDALKDYIHKHQSSIPGFPEWKFFANSEPNGTDPTLARLMWLEYWVRWAVENCERPVIANM